jgi:hypothetical protein
MRGDVVAPGRPVCGRDGARTRAAARAARLEAVPPRREPARLVFVAARREDVQEGGARVPAAGGRRPAAGGATMPRTPAELRIDGRSHRHWSARPTAGSPRRWRISSACGVASIDNMTLHVSLRVPTDCRLTYTAGRRSPASKRSRRSRSCLFRRAPPSFPHRSRRLRSRGSPGVRTRGTSGGRTRSPLPAPQLPFRCSDEVGERGRFLHVRVVPPAADRGFHESGIRVGVQERPLDGVARLCFVES